MSSIAACCRINHDVWL